MRMCSLLIFNNNGTLPNYAMKKIKYFLLIIPSLYFSACITMSLPIQKNAISPKIFMTSKKHSDSILKYEERQAFRFGILERKAFLYTGERTISALEKYKQGISEETLAKTLHAIPPSNQDSGEDITVYTEYSEKIIVFYTNPDLAEKIRAEEEKLELNRFDNKGNIIEVGMSATKARIQKEISSGKIPEGIEVILIPTTLEPSTSEKAKNIGFYCLVPVTIVLDILSSPVQLVYFLVTGKGKYLLGAFR